MNSRTDGSPLTSAVSVNVASAGTYGAGAGTLTHRGSGMWEYVFTQGETNFSQFGYQFTRASGVDVSGTIVPTAADPTDAAAFGLTRLDAAVTTRMATFTLPTNFSALSISAAGLVDILQTAADKVWGSATRALTAFSTALAVSVWDVLTASIGTASSIGVLLKTNVDAVLSAIAARLPAALTGAGNMKADMLAINGATAEAAALQKALTIEYVGSVTGATTTTTLIDSGLTQADTDFWKGRIVIFLTGALKYQATDITAFDPATDKLTFTACTVAAGAGDTYVVV